MQSTLKSFVHIVALAATLMIWGAGGAFAGEADVVDVNVRKTGDGVYSFSVTLRHADTGWKHYADRWDVLDGSGNVLGKRVLLHPHVNEQPFTRGLSGVRIPKSIVKVTVRAHDLVHGLGGAVKTVDLPH